MSSREDFLDKENAELRRKIKIAVSLLKSIKITAVVNGQEGQQILLNAINRALDEIEA